jgi:hypothetical protein
MKINKTLAVSIILIMFLAMAGILPNVSARQLYATSPTLGDAESFSVLGGETITNTGDTTISGDVGVSSGSAITGFPPGIVGPPGVIQDAATTALAQIANSTAFDFLDQGCDVTYPAGVKDLVGETLVPGVYCADAFELSGTLTLSGSGVWIFKSASTLITSGTANVVGSDPCNVWWRVVSSATLGTNTSLIGNILALTSISLATGASLDGRAFAQTGAVTLDDNTIIGLICLPQPAPTEQPTQEATAPAVSGLPESGGAPIRNQSFPWSLVIVSGFSFIALVFGVRAFRNNYRTK